MRKNIFQDELPQRQFKEVVCIMKAKSVVNRTISLILTLVLVIMFMPVANLAASADGIVINGKTYITFEDGTFPTGVTLDAYGSTSITAAPVAGHGDCSLKHTWTSGNRTILRTHVNFLAGHTYQISLYYYYEAQGEESSYTPWFTLFASGTSIGSGVYNARYGEWISFTRTYTPNENKTYMDIIANKVNAYFDDIIIRDITYQTQTQDLLYVETDFSDVDTATAECVKAGGANASVTYEYDAELGKNVAAVSFPASNVSTSSMLCFPYLLKAGTTYSLSLTYKSDAWSCLSYNDSAYDSKMPFGARNTYGTVTYTFTPSADRCLYIGAPKAAVNMRIARIVLTEVVPEPGDLDNDGDILANDLVLLRKHLLGFVDNSIFGNACDVNEDFAVDIHDLVALKKILVRLDSGFLPHSLTVSFYDTSTSTYGFTWNCDLQPLESVLQLCEGKDFNENQCVEYSAVVTQENTYTKSSETNSDLAKNYYVCKVQVQLEPNQIYTYRVYDKNSNFGSTPAVLKTKDPNTTKITFAHVSDSQVKATNGRIGGNATAIPFGNTLRGITENCPDLDFILHTGDMVEYSLYEQYWRSMIDYNFRYLASIPMMHISGNHETTYRNGAYEQLKHFNVMFPSQNNKNGYYYTFDYGNTRFIMLNTNRLTGNKLTDDQYNWLVSALQNNDQKWTIVALHNPMYSVGQWGADSSKNQISLALREQLVDLFAENHVDLVLQGHDHTYSKTYPIGVGQQIDTDLSYQTIDSVKYCVNPNGVIYAMNGPAGTQTRTPVEVDDSIYELAGASQSSSWAKITVEEDKLTVKVMYSTNGYTLVWNSYGIIKND